MMKYKNNNENQKFIENEIKALSGFEHPNVCKLMQVLRYQNGILLVMPKYDGNLFQLQSEMAIAKIWDINSKTKDYAFEEPQVKLLFKQIYEALKYVHSKGWAHRDLKLENIMYAKTDSFYEIKLADFGLATQNSKSESICGTLGFMSAECLGRRRYDTRKNDVWGFAVVLLRLVTGKEFRINEYLVDNPPSKDKRSAWKRLKQWGKVRAQVKELEAQFRISKALAKVFLKVFVPEDERMDLDEFYNQVMRVKHLRP